MCPLKDGVSGTVSMRKGRVALQLAAVGIAGLCGSFGDASGPSSCASLGATMIMCDGSCVVRASCSDVPLTAAVPRTAAACAQLAPLRAFAGCHPGYCSPRVAPCSTYVVARVVSAVPIAPSALAAIFARRFAGAIRYSAAQVNCSIELRDMPGSLTDYTSASSALRFSMRRGIATPVGLTEAAVVGLTAAVGRRQLQAGNALRVVATLVGPTDHDLTAIAASNYVVDMAAGMVATAQQLASRSRLVDGVDCTASACDSAVTIASEIQAAAAADDGLERFVEFVHRFNIAVDDSGSTATQLTPQLLQDIVAAATGASPADFAVTVDTVPSVSPSPLPPPTPPTTPPVPSPEDTLVDGSWFHFAGSIGLAVAVSTGSLLCLGCGILCCMLCRRSAPVGGIKDRATGVGMARAKARAEQTRERVNRTLDQRERGQP